MSEKQVVVRQGGIGLGPALFLVFLTLKLTNNIDWSWWWVTAPLWGTAALVVGIVLVYVVGAVLLGLTAVALDSWSARRKR